MAGLRHFMDNEKDIQNIIEIMRFCARRDITKLYKDFLLLLADLKAARQDSRDKLENAIPEQYQLLLDCADWMDENKQAYVRKRILDLGNQAIRDQIELIDKFQIFLGLDQETAPSEGAPTHLYK